MNIKFIVFRQKAEYGWISHLELAEHPDVLMDRDISNSFLYKINNFCTSAKVNKHIKIPFQSIWYNCYLDESKLDPKNEYIFMFEEGSRPYLIEGYLKYLKKKYPKSHLVFAAFNSVVQYSEERLKFFETNYDYITSFDRGDCEKRGWGLYTGIYSKINDINPDGHYESDVYFAGKNKGRLPLLYE